MADFANEPWLVDLSRITWQRWIWNTAALRNGRWGGFQYSEWFLDLVEEQIPQELWETEIITFNQHFPRAATVRRNRGLLNHYVDAPFAALISGRGLELRLADSVVRRALQGEMENYAASERVITMGRWAADVMTQECGVAEEKVHTILPGANLTLPENWTFPDFKEGAGTERDFILGFVGKDWERKGLLWLLDLRDELTRRGLRVAVHAAGNAPQSLKDRPGLLFAGFIDKAQAAAQFRSFLTGCDLGCLFSRQEALGISTLEFLRAGVPVAGYSHEGMADTLPPDAGFRFDLSVSVPETADVLESYILDGARQQQFHLNAQRWSPRLTWERCVSEFQELWTTGMVRTSVRPWLGLPSGLELSPDLDH